MKPPHLNPILAAIVVVLIGCAPAPNPQATANAISTEETARVRARATAEAELALKATPPPTSTKVPVVVMSPTFPAFPTLTPPSVVVPTGAPSPYVRLANRHTQMCLTAQRGTRAIVQEPCGDNRPEQYWKWGTVTIDLESQSGICIGYNLGFGHDDNALVQVGCSNFRPWTVYLVQWPGDPPPLKVAQHPHPTTTPLSPALELKAYYYIAMSDGDCVDVEAWSHEEGHRIIHTPCQCPLRRDYDNQLWAPY